MSKYPNLSEADSFIMEILWRDGESKSADILSEVGSMRNWSRQTVRTYLVRLIEKGLVGTKLINKRTLHYYPIVSRDEYAKDKAGSVFHKYGVSLPHLVAGLIKDDAVTDKDLDALEQLIKQCRNKDGGGT